MSETSDPMSTDSSEVALPPVTAPPGWYPDPQGRREERYWNGTAWTDVIRPPVYASGQLTVAPDGTPVSPSSRLVVLLLAIFLGSLGVHSFYVGKVGVGLGQLAITLVTCGMLGWIWPLIDVILIAVGSYRDNARLLVLNWNS